MGYAPWINESAYFIADDQLGRIKSSVRSLTPVLKSKTIQSPDQSCFSMMIAGRRFGVFFEVFIVICYAADSSMSTIDLSLQVV